MSSRQAEALEWLLGAACEPEHRSGPGRWARGQTQQRGRPSGRPGGHPVSSGQVLFMNIGQ